MLFDVLYVLMQQNRSLHHICRGKGITSVLVMEWWHLFFTRKCLFDIVLYWQILSLLQSYYMSFTTSHADTHTDDWEAMKFNSRMFFALISNTWSYNKIIKKSNKLLYICMLMDFWFDAMKKIISLRRSRIKMNPKSSHIVSAPAHGIYHN